MKIWLIWLPLLPPLLLLLLVLLLLEFPKRGKTQYHKATILRIKCMDVFFEMFFFQVFMSVMKHDG